MTLTTKETNLLKDMKGQKIYEYMSGCGMYQ